MSDLPAGKLGSLEAWKPGTRTKYSVVWCSASHPCIPSIGTSKRHQRHGQPLSFHSFVFWWGGRSSVAGEAEPVACHPPLLVAVSGS